MAKKKSEGGGLDRAYDIVSGVIGGSGATDDELAYLRKLYRGDRGFRSWFDGNVGNFVTLSNGRVRDAKDAYATFGFTPLPRAKDAGPGTQKMILRSGRRTNQTGAFQDVKLERRSAGNRTGYVATPEGGRRRTQGETEAIIRRGQAGGRLGLEDQRIYDKWMADRTAEREAAMREKAQAEAARKAEEERVKRRADKLSVLGVADDGKLTDAQVDDLVARREARLKSDEEIRRQSEIETMKSRQKADAEAAAEAKWRAENNIDPDDVVPDYAREKIKSGDKAWGYRPDDQRAIDALEAEYSRIIREGDASEEDRANLSNQIDEYKRRVRKGLIDNPNGLTVEQALAKTKRDEDGVLWGMDRNGELTKLLDAKETPEDKAERTARENEEKRRAAQQTRRDSWITSQTNELMKETKKDADGYTDVPKYDYEEALDIARKRAVLFFGPEDADYGSVADLGGEYYGEDGGEAATTSQEICPECGAPLDANGVCTNPDCGYGKVSEASPSQAAQPSAHVKSSYL